MLFWPGLSAPAVKERFTGCMKYASASTSISKVASRSGCVDDAPAIELQQGVEKTYTIGITIGVIPKESFESAIPCQPEGGEHYRGSLSMQIVHNHGLKHRNKV